MNVVMSVVSVFLVLLSLLLLYIFYCMLLYITSGYYCLMCIAQWCLYCTLLVLSLSISTYVSATLVHTTNKTTWTWNIIKIHSILSTQASKRRNTNIKPVLYERMQTLHHKDKKQFIINVPIFMWIDLCSISNGTTVSAKKWNCPSGHKGQRAFYAFFSSKPENEKVMHFKHETSII